MTASWNSLGKYSNRRDTTSSPKQQARGGIEKALTYRPDLIILDLMIPDMDGFELSRVLKNNAATVDIPIIILTAKDITLMNRSPIC